MLSVDFFFGLFLLLLALGCTVVSIGIGNWSETNFEFTIVNETVPVYRMKQINGLWEVCATVYLSGRDSGTQCSLVWNDDDIMSTSPEDDPYVYTYQQNNNQDTYTYFYEFEEVENFTMSALTTNTERYPDYLKIMQGLELLAGVCSLAAIIVWFVFVVRSGAKIAAVVLALLAAASSGASVIYWVVQKEDEKSEFPSKEEVMELSEASFGVLDFSSSLEYGWSWGVGVGGAILHLVAIIPMILSPTDDDDYSDDGSYKD